MRERPIIIALDFATQNQLDEFIHQFPDEKLFLKVGMELFYREGPPLVRRLKEEGHQIFLDLKLHDIPTTVQRAMVQLAQLEVDLVNVHAMGGVDMMKAAREGLDAGTSSGKKRPKCIAVTQLTSTTTKMLNNELAVDMPVNDHVLHLCHQVEKAELDGVVCSALEVPSIKEMIKRDFLTVTPGIRRSIDGNNDQVRVVTPEKANKLGADAIVVGRGITRDSNPYQAYMQYKSEWRQ